MRYESVLSIAFSFALATMVDAQESTVEFAADRVPAPPPIATQAAPSRLSLPQAIGRALENNPALIAQRRQRGIATSRLVIADTYPFNPSLETRVQSASGPPAAGVTNKTPVEALLLWEVELRGQIHHRRVGAAAALSRTEWEIVAQEQAVAVQVLKAYAALQYRQEKLQLLEETLNLNERLVRNVGSLVTAGRLRTADLIVARTEVSINQDALAGGREAETAARQDLFRALGVVTDTFEVEGPFEPAAWTVDSAALGQLAATLRPDLRARQLAVTEAAANVRLANANRFGNPTLGAVVGYDPSKIQTVGAQINIPLPVANLRRGEVMQSEAEHVQAVMLLKQAEINVQQDVAAALARLSAAERRAEQVRTKVLPDIRQAVSDMQKLFEAGEPGIDLLRVMDVRRKLLQARDSYLDTIWSVRQGRADVAAAVGDLSLGLAGSSLEPPARMGSPRP